MVPLKQNVTALRVRAGDGCEIPDFDPLDGGIEASIIFLLEAPGPQAVISGFVSRNNPDPSARNMLELLIESAVPRREIVLWNIVPWYVGGEGRIRPVIQRDISSALAHLRQLLDLLPKVRVIVLVGKKSAERKVPAGAILSRLHS